MLIAKFFMTVFNYPYFNEDLSIAIISTEYYYTQQTIHEAHFFVAMSVSSRIF